MREPTAPAYYDRRAPEYDDWYLGRGLYADRDREGFDEELADVCATLGRLRPAKTLDVACGTGFLTRHLPGAVTGLDQSARMLRVAAERVPGASLVRDVGAPFSAIVVVTERPTTPIDPASLRLLNPVLDSHAAVHVIARQPSGLTPDQDGAPRAETDVLRDLAQQTGGQYTPVFSVASYGAALERLAERMVSELLVEYLVPPGAKAERVRIGVRVPGARVLRLKVSR